MIFRHGRKTRGGFNDDPLLAAFAVPGLCSADGDFDGGEGGSGGGAHGAIDRGAGAGPDDVADRGAGAGDGGVADGGGPPDWRDALPDDLRPHAKNFHTAADAVKTAAALRQKLSGAVVVPGEGAGAEEVAAYRRAIGCPETAEGYAYTVPDNVPDYLRRDGADESARQAFFEAMHARNVPQEHVTAAMDWYWQNLSEMDAAFGERARKVEADCEAKVKEMWGDDYDTNMALMKRGMDSCGQDLVDYLDATGLGNHPEIAKVFHDLGKYRSEDAMVSGGSDGASRSLHDRAAELRARPDRWTNPKVDQELQDIARKLHGTAPVGPGSSRV